MFRLVPKDKNVALLIRHAHRPEIPKGKYGNEILLSTKGIKQAKEFGEKLPFKINQVFSSPVERCIQTAKYISNKEKINKTDILSTAFIKDVSLAGPLFLQKGPLYVTNQLLQSKHVKGMENIETGVKKLMKLMFSQQGFNIFVTHDNLIALIVYYFLEKKEINDDDWPQFLEGAYLWQEDNKYKMLWRDRIVVLTNQ